MFTLDELEAALDLVHAQVPPTPQIHWPQLGADLGAEVWVKHENAAPTGAFKVRGGVTLIDWLRRTHPDCPGIITATRGNHGQSQARAAVAAGLRAVVYVPHGNSVEKNAAMRAFGAELREHGPDFDTAREEAMRVAAAEGLYAVPPFHPELVRGVATYALELFRAAPPLDRVYVPIGCGSGICGVIAARDALGLATEIVGVVAEGAPGAALSFAAGHVVETGPAHTFADGLAVRVPVPEALAIYGAGAARVLTVSDDQIAAAIRALFSGIHAVAEGAGAAAYAGLLAEAEINRGKRLGVIVSGGNIDSPWMATLLSGGIPTPG
ncbi:threonine dehydratase [Phaeovulum vinaykumarii]|uniref:Threonine dehydratase n=1 Tax=Phaeovulum vinaykumarii TaxID=407234 RepID=A0A1N7LJC9_9RHOB|nr:threonine dehydratase [Phaeovulum vinaykumarii]SIS73912.1 threonine dehydratase [Phaeovulum vinaykumarii]SOC04819.1 threonine dehydratase [Phaeovulum vinaykumarii]